MDKNSIISTISIEFGLSKEQAETVINSIFNSIEQSLKKNKNLEIQKFGKFKLSNDKDSVEYKVKFTPSKKLALRVNGNFENLKKVKLRPDLLEIEEAYTHYKFPQNIIENVNSKSETITNTETVNENEIIITEVPRKLIPDDLVRLHKEIVNEDEKKSSNPNLWG